MGTEKRERQKANRQKRLEQEAVAEVRDERRAKLIKWGSIGAAVVVFVVGYSLIFGGDDGDEENTATTTTTAVATGPYGTTPCPSEDGEAVRTTSFEDSFENCLTAGTDYTAVIRTSMGEIAVDLNEELAPVTVSNFVALARNGYYDGAPFHRVIPGFMIQGGDGNPGEGGLGTGSPGYTIDEEVDENTAYEIGTIAMAKLPAAGTSSAQFFIVTGAQGTALPGEYTNFGEVTEGMDNVTEIEAVDTGDGTEPLEEVLIEGVDIIEL